MKNQKAEYDRLGFEVLTRASPSLTIGDDKKITNKAK